jgi:hypothetical protein
MSGCSIGYFGEDCQNTLVGTFTAAWYTYRALANFLCFVLCLVNIWLLIIHNKSGVNHKTILGFSLVIGVILTVLSVVDPLNYENLVPSLFISIVWDMMIPLYSMLYNLIICYW